MIFYSQNCCRQSKNHFMLPMYPCDVTEYPFINSIIDKFLVKRHSQNEGDIANTAFVCGAKNHVHESSYNVKKLAIQSEITNNTKNSNDDC